MNKILKISGLTLICLSSFTAGWFGNSYFSRSVEGEQNSSRIPQTGYNLIINTQRENEEEKTTIYSLDYIDWVSQEGSGFDNREREFHGWIEYVPPKIVGR
ncbi:hypothetical protein CMI42_00230 [Candidatus Pacearchaeota archaeon]|nr:hypothetical protein [Candidatus Pacearchaeota archaeon]|tara:strand:+ start:1475 stop:1777 length:303 start_codon:yes stop_codon:yes gene_type:complete